MKVATWNIDQLQFNATRATRQQDHLRAVAPDVWVFTETCAAFTPGDGFERVACADPAPDALGGQWVAIWSRVGGQQVSLKFDSQRCAAIKLENGVVIVGTVLPVAQRFAPIAAYRERSVPGSLTGTSRGLDAVT